MKKLLSLILVAAMLCGSIIMVSANGTETDFSQYLISHWAFDDSNPTADTADNGNPDTLKITGNITFANGTATVPSASGNTFSVDIDKTGADDVGDLKGKTFVFKIKFDNTNPAGTSAATPFYKVNTFRWQVKNQQLLFRTWKSGNSQRHDDNIPTIEDTLFNGEYRYYVISYYYTGTNIVITMSYSNDDTPESAADFTTITVVDAADEADAQSGTTRDIVFGKNASSDNTVADIIYDDIKLYNAVMSPADVVSTLVEPEEPSGPSDEPVDENAMDLSSDLVTWWNFEGAEPLADKADDAGNGNSADDLAVFDATNANVSYEGGAVRISGAAKCFLWIRNLSEGQDLYTLKDKTIVAKIKIEKSSVTDPTTNTALLSIPGACSHTTLSDSNKFYFRTHNSSGDLTKTNKGVGSYASDGFKYLVISYDYDETTNTLVENYYYSDTATPASSEDYTSVYSKTHESDASALTSTGATGSLCIGKTYGYRAQNHKEDLIIDDIKVYGKVMSIEEVAMATAAPELKGVQLADDNGNFGIRFFGTIDTVAVDGLGYKVKAIAGSTVKDIEKNCTEVYYTLNANNGHAKAQASDYSREYIYAYSIMGIDKAFISGGAEMSFEVTPFVEIGEKTVTYETVYVTVTYDATLDDPYVVSMSRTAS